MIFKSDSYRILFRSLQVSYRYRRVCVYDSYMICLGFVWCFLEVLLGFLEFYYKFIQDAYRIPIGLPCGPFWAPITIVYVSYMVHIDFVQDSSNIAPSFLQDSYISRTGFVQDSYIISQSSHQDSYNFRVRFVWYSYMFCMGFVWDFVEAPIGFIQLSYRISIGIV